jgi:hypothetical protein
MKSERERALVSSNEENRFYSNSSSPSTSTS